MAQCVNLRERNIITKGRHLRTPSVPSTRLNRTVPWRLAMRALKSELAAFARSKGPRGVGWPPPLGSLCGTDVLPDAIERFITSTSGSTWYGAQLLKLCVLRLGLFEDWDVGIGILPKRQEILVSGLRFRAVAGQDVGAAQAQVCQSSNHRVSD